MDVDPFAGERRHVQRTVAESPLDHLVPTLENDHIVGAVVRCSVSHFYACPLLDPLLPRLVRSERFPLGMTLSSVRQAALRHHQLAEDERDDIGGLPVGGVEEVWKGVGGEVCESVRAVEGVVQPLASPPLGPQAAHRLHLPSVENPGLDAFAAAPPAATQGCRGVVEEQRVRLDHLNQAQCVAVPSRILPVP